MNKQDRIKRACQVLRRKVYYMDAGLVLPGSSMDNSKADTNAIRKATRRYTDSWIVPLVDAIESGNQKLLEDLIDWERTLEMGQRPEDIHP